MSVYFDYPSIKDFFDIPGNCAAENLDDYEDRRFESEKTILHQQDDIERESSKEDLKS
ncbi:hypothetical protein [Pedobacter chinensis]|uniref:hypothetical protein n=1 Tax=Pedobacter chinensis TaxID=2282421 RepID=UPI0013144DFF|nr:hypothetical protein [Pedobacter chinensis]